MWLLGSLSCLRLLLAGSRLSVCPGRTASVPPPSSTLQPDGLPVQERCNHRTFLQGQLSSQVQLPAHSHLSPQGILMVGVWDLQCVRAAKRRQNGLLSGRISIRWGWTAERQPTPSTQQPDSGSCVRRPEGTRRLVRCTTTTPQHSDGRTAAVQLSSAPQRRAGMVSSVAAARPATTLHPLALLVHEVSIESMWHHARTRRWCPAPSTVLT